MCTKNGKVFSFGENDYGQLGVADIESTAKPVCVTALPDNCIVKVSCGNNHSAVLAGKQSTNKLLLLQPHKGTA